MPKVFIDIHCTYPLQPFAAYFGGHRPFWDPWFYLPALDSRLQRCTKRLSSESEAPCDPQRRRVGRLERRWAHHILQLQGLPKKKQNRPLWECANCSISCAKIQQNMAQPDKIEFHSSAVHWLNALCHSKHCCTVVYRPCF